MKIIYQTFIFSLQPHNQKLPCCVYLAALAVTDNLFLINCFELTVMMGLFPKYFGDSLCVFMAMHYHVRVEFLQFSFIIYIRFLYKLFRHERYKTILRIPLHYIFATNNVYFKTLKNNILKHSGVWSYQFFHCNRRDSGEILSDLFPSEKCSMENSEKGQGNLTSQIIFLLCLWFMLRVGMAWDWNLSFFRNTIFRV